MGASHHVRQRQDMLQYEQVRNPDQLPVMRYRALLLCHVHQETGRLLT